MNQALVTGAGQRVGQALALALGAQGYRVLVHFHRSSDGAAETVRQIEAQGGQAVAVGCDLSDQAAVE
jgi:NAD(P)-dependent dehydrogenase (short-subunit alcohol dehydrogenase family)